MKAEEKCVSLETAKKLKEAGFPQDQSLFYWRLRYSTSESFDNGKSLGKKGEFGEYHVEYYPKPRFTTADVKWNQTDLIKLDETEYDAPDAQELGLPESIGKEGEHGHLHISYGTRTTNKWTAGYANYKERCSEIFDHESLAEALAACWLWLKENKLI
jgi:hypothetical protein